LFRRLLISAAAAALTRFPACPLTLPNIFTGVHGRLAHGKGQTDKAAGGHHALRGRDNEDSFRHVIDTPFEASL